MKRPLWAKSTVTTFFSRPSCFTKPIEVKNMTGVKLTSYFLLSTFIWKPFSGFKVSVWQPVFILWNNTCSQTGITLVSFSLTCREFLNWTELQILIITRFPSSSNRISCFFPSHCLPFWPSVLSNGVGPLKRSITSESLYFLRRQKLGSWLWSPD